jgi:outer membrane protein TolC
MTNGSRIAIASIIACELQLGARVAAQDVRSDTLHLGALQARAMRADPRATQLGDVAVQSALRLRNLAAERRPVIGVEGQAQYQSDVPRVPVAQPGGPPPPPHDTYDARIAATQRLVDPTLGARRDIEQAQRAQSEARVRVSLFTTRQQLNEAYFSALRAQVQRDELSAAIDALEAQLSVAAARVREGAALPSEEYTIRAELLRRRQTLAEVEITRRAALAVLADFVELPIPSDVVLALPDLADDVAAARSRVAELKSRPEFEQFEQSRTVLAMQARARGAQDLPRVSAFGRAGYGRPGLNPLASEFDTYWLAGVQLQWSPWNWGARGRDQEVLALQRRIVSADEQAFVEQLQRAVTLEVAAIERLETALALDDDIIVLRQRIVEETRARFEEAAVTSADYVNRQTELLSARIARALHRVELAEARARLLTTLGLEVR